jgi:hypothetical protein
VVGEGGEWVDGDAADGWGPTSLSVLSREPTLSCNREHPRKYPTAANSVQHSIAEPDTSARSSIIGHLVCSL